MIKKITIDQLVPGMFVHQILEQKGALRVTSQGRVTSDDVVKTLRKRGVKTLAIDTDKAFNVFLFPQRIYIYKSLQTVFQQ